MSKLNLTNTMSGLKEEFIPIDPPQIKMYVCGITPYDYAHLGHGRCYVTFDVLYRLLKFLGYQVTYCRNFTDIDDKIINRAIIDFNNPADYKIITDKYISLLKKI